MKMPPHLTRDLGKPDAIPEAGIAKVAELLREGRLCRYGEVPAGELTQTAAFEREFATYIGRDYAMAVNSCGCALYLTLKALGVAEGDEVLMNAFTLAPVPGAVAHAGAQPVFVETAPNLTVDLESLDRTAAKSSARILLLSHMRGHIADMRAVLDLCVKHELILVEDCAHTLGARWDGQLSGTFGHVACFSTQAYKHLNSGEGGIVATDDAEVAAKVIARSGSYMFHEQNGTVPPPASLDAVKLATPNCSMRMSEVHAVLLRAQLPDLDERCRLWTRSHDLLRDAVKGIPGLTLIERDPREAYVGSSFQFVVTPRPPASIPDFIATCGARGLHVKWFGLAEPKGFTSRYSTWRYVEDPQSLPATDRILDGLCDIRVPTDLDAQDCATIAAILRDALDRTEP
jgi:dTDP-4-amino-4,6-dideoxygalactose transaminase